MFITDQSKRWIDWITFNCSKFFLYFFTIFVSMLTPEKVHYWREKSGVHMKKQLFGCQFAGKYAFIKPVSYRPYFDLKTKIHFWNSLMIGDWPRINKATFSLWMSNSLNLLDFLKVKFCVKGSRLTKACCKKTGQIITYNETRVNSFRTT